MFYSFDEQKLEKTVFNAAIYIRLSREDENREQSESIQNQRTFLIQFISSKKWNLIDIYCDDGYSGTNFDRPDFKRLINDIENKKINMVITKDLSRLGRDYIDTGFYLERYFPEHNIRYIAVNDGIDTFTSNNGNNDISPFKSIMNDLYAKDISKKVRTTMDTKRINGKFIGAFAPFGYLKNPKDKNKLIVDENTAPIIRRIFAMYLDGFGLSSIANKLNYEGVLTPSTYKSIHSNYRNGKVKYHLWSHYSVKSILTNPTYTGCISQNKFRKINYKVKTLKKVPKDEWIVVEDTHEAIIDKEIFKHVQNMIALKGEVKKPQQNQRHLFAGLLVCGDCGQRMTFTTTASGNHYCICSSYKRFKKCSRHSVSEKELQEIITFELKKLLQYAALDIKKMFVGLKKARQQTLKANIDNKISLLDNRMNEITTIIKSLYDDRSKAIITDQLFFALLARYNKEKEKINKQVQVLQSDSKKYSKNQEPMNILNESIDDIFEFVVLNQSVLTKLIARIDVYEMNKIIIYYQFKNPFLVP